MSASTEVSVAAKPRRGDSSDEELARVGKKRHSEEIIESRAGKKKSNGSAGIDNAVIIQHMLNDALIAAGHSFPAGQALLPSRGAADIAYDFPQVKKEALSSRSNDLAAQRPVRAECCDTAAPMARCPDQLASAAPTNRGSQWSGNLSKGDIQPRSMREKNRRHRILAAFSKLEDAIPSTFCQQRRASFTKMDTCTLISMAIQYIKSLEQRRENLAKLCMSNAMLDVQPPFHRGNFFPPS
ncbi:hypothetical protein CLOM_g7023 [Closterium sp. NIES-68]|nr:hypothetical protein CLOM_g23303 [Closterium sp. NIES-68]GJP47845.1 hypothetical protein CLOM_g7023 [Closterium sp. NIES-68]GJP60979.1 hypothetical protein CLOP_g18190 [Closterium sp. NIES-67]GJP61636.1 hypothetical protein CLOP_g18777 [Closterium sp. NIES-67]